MKTTISALFCLLCIFGNSQVTEYTFFDYLRDNYNPDDTAECGTSTELIRMNKLWGPRLGKTASISAVATTIVNFTNEFHNTNRHKSLSYNPNWQCLGPTGSNGTNNPDVEVGRMNRICFDPNYDGVTNQVIYAASEFGGLWRTTDNGYNWSNVNTDLQLPTTSIGDVVVSYQNSGHIFVATGMGDYGLAYWTGNKSNSNPVFTWGIYRSTDYGTNWEPVNDGFLDNLFEKVFSLNNCVIFAERNNIISACSL